MSNKSLRTVLICVICVLVTVLVALASLLVIRATQQPSGTVETTAATTQSTTAATTEATTATTEATTVATTVETEPQPVRYVLTFAGDCTLGNQKGASLQSGFVGTIGTDYSYPFADVMEYFANDTATFINLEGTFTEYPYAEDKMFAFKGPKEYINILTQGSVEFANVANNHSYDYGQQGYNDTIALLEENGIAYGESKQRTIFEVADGLKIGVYSVAGAYNTNGLAENIKALKKEGADIIVACMHWGEEYYYVPNQDQIIIARAAIDAGADIVYGHHPHVLQKIEEYKDGIIFYSLGNFSFGGNNSPADKDTAILQQEFIRYPDGTLEMGELTIIPCYVSGILEYGNDYQPMPIPETDETAYQRVLTKLAGKYHLTNLYVSYRDDLNTTAPADTTVSTEGTGSDETVGEETQPAEVETQPAEVETQPAEPETQPAEPETQPAEPETQPSTQETQPAVEESPPAAPETQPVVDSGDSSGGEAGGEEG